MTVSTRFLEKVSPEPNTGCWLWTASLDGRGYGQFQVGTRKKPKIVRAHRFSYELQVGPIPDGLDLDHLCRIPSCVNPDHLEPVTRSENLKRGDLSHNSGNKGKTHCKHGHEFTEENTYQYRGHRSCKECRRSVWDKQNAKRKMLRAERRSSPL